MQMSEDRGLYEKFRVRRMDGTTNTADQDKHEETYDPVGFWHPVDVKRCLDLKWFGFDWHSDFTVCQPDSEVPTNQVCAYCQCGFLANSKGVWLPYASTDRCEGKIEYPWHLSCFLLFLAG